jgi:hypothetical protein
MTIQLPDRGLIVRKEWLDLIYDGLKIMEMRSTRTNIRGRIALIEAGTGLITGETKLIDCGKAMTRVQALGCYHMHQVKDMSLIDKWKYPWILAEPYKYMEPIPYKHPRGAVIWVDLKNLELKP